jgi:L-amino acid N-acyltransferase YncA
MNSLAEILVKNYPKNLNLENGTDITLRPLLKEDEPAFLAYFQSLPPEDLVRLRDEVTDPRVIGSWMEQLDYDVMMPLIPLHGDRIVGAASLQFGPIASSRHQGEVHLSTHGQYRDKGLGTMLLQSLVDLAAALGLEQLTAKIPPELDKAFPLFKKLGFEKGGVLKGFAMARDGHESDIVLLIKKLAPAAG